MKYSELEKKLRKLDVTSLTTVIILYTNPTNS